jgi:threonine dehydrogenase-like Zn-dependent dehydrogenase
MRSLVYAAPGTVAWREAPEPRLHSDLEAIVMPVAASRCDYDREIVRGISPLPPPFAIGHEAVGRVVTVGDAVRTVIPGDLAVVVWHVSCGECDRCRRGLTGHCRQVPPGSAYGAGGPWGGLFDDSVRVPFADAMLTPVPSGLDPIEVSAAGDGLGLGHAIISRQIQAGHERVAVFGRGEHGLYHVAFAVELGMQSVVYVDDSPERRTIATGLGAHEVAASPTQAAGPFDLIVDAAGNEDWLHGAILMLEPEGVIECIGGYFGDMPIPGFASYINGVTIRFGLGNNGPHVQPTIDAVTRGAIRPSAIWTTQIAWEDLPIAYIEEPRKLVAIRAPN